MSVFAPITWTGANSAGSAASVTTTGVTTTGVTTTSGNLLVVGVVAFSVNISGSPVTDSKSNIWTQAVVQNGGTPEWGYSGNTQRNAQGANVASGWSMGFFGFAGQITNMGLCAP